MPPPRQRRAVRATPARSRAARSPVAAAKPARRPPRRGAPASGAAIFERLLEDVLTGKYAAGMRLPPERELATELRASRATVREALRQLGALRLIDAPRQGSGVSVRSVRDWSFEVLPYYVKLGAPLSRGGALGDLVRELLDLRREVVLGLLRQIAPRIAKRPGSIERVAERAHAAWARRGDAVGFVREDLEVLGALLEESGMLVSLWLLNSLGEVYVQLARDLGDRICIPDDYVENNLAVAAALAQGDAELACRHMSRMLAENDRQILRTLGLLDGRPAGDA